MSKWSKEKDQRALEFLSYCLDNKINAWQAVVKGITTRGIAYQHIKWAKYSQTPELQAAYTKYTKKLTPELKQYRLNAIKERKEKLKKEIISKGKELIQRGYTQTEIQQMFGIDTNLYYDFISSNRELEPLKRYDDLTDGVIITLLEMRTNPSSIADLLNVDARYISKVKKNNKLKLIKRRPRYIRGTIYSDYEKEAERWYKKLITKVKEFEKKYKQYKKLT